MDNGAFRQKIARFVSPNSAKQPPKHVYPCSHQAKLRRLEYPSCQRTVIALWLSGGLIYSALLTADCLAPVICSAKKKKVRRNQPTGAPVANRWSRGHSFMSEPPILPRAATFFSPRPFATFLPVFLTSQLAFIHSFFSGDDNDNDNSSAELANSST